MKLKAKIHLENQRTVAEGRLAARLELLYEKSLESVAIKRDPVIRKIRADIRKANYRLATIAAQEKLNAEKAQIRAEKLVKEKGNGEKAPAKTPEPVPKKKSKQQKKKEPSPAAKSKKQEKGNGEQAPAKAPEPVPKKESKQQKKKEPSPAAKSKKQEKGGTS